MSKTREELRAERRQETTLPANVDREIEKGRKALLKKQEKQERIERTLDYQAVKGGAWFKEVVDPVLGFIVPGVGDILGATLSLPALYVAIFYVRSLPLVLAVLYYNLMDLLIGSVPVVGDIIDLFYHSHRKSAKAVVGFVEGDEDIKEEVNRKAIFMGIAIVILGILLYFVIKWVATLVTWLLDQFSDLIG